MNLPLDTIICGDNTVTRYRLCPLDHATAKSFVARYHRHNKPPVGWKFCVGLERSQELIEGGDSSGAGGLDWELIGVAIAGRPVARSLDSDKRCIEITRVCVTEAKNANSRLYGAILRAAKSLGYDIAYTYTLQSESGVSLLASGFVRDAEVSAAATWNCKARKRVQVDLFGQHQRPQEAKIRWKRVL